MNQATPLTGSITIATLQGHREEQEDALCATEILSEHGTRAGWLLAILDGHKGNIISNEATARIRALTPPLHGMPLHEKDTARKMLREMMRTLTNEYAKYEEGSTISLLYISETGRHATIAYLGDSPIIILDKDGAMSRSEPHNARTNTRDRDHATQRGGHYHDGMIWWGDKGLEPTRTLGNADFDHLQIRNPGMYTIDLGEKSIALIASDGIITCGAHKQKKFFRSLLSELALDPSIDASQLTKQAMENGSQDNISVILYRA